MRTGSRSTARGPERPWRVRPARSDDLPAISAIYNHYVEHSTCTFALEPMTESASVEWFDRRDPNSHPVTVALRSGGVVGWGALSPWKPRGGYDRTVEASVYVHPDLHRRGIGSTLLSDLIDRARSLGHRTIVGGTCTEHPGSLELQRRLGFEEVGRMRDVGYKFGRWLDVVHTQLML